MASPHCTHRAGRTAEKSETRPGTVPRRTRRLRSRTTIMPSGPSFHFRRQARRRLTLHHCRQFPAHAARPATTANWSAKTPLWWSPVRTHGDACRWSVRRILHPRRTAGAAFRGTSSRQPTCRASAKAAPPRGTKNRFSATPSVNGVFRKVDISAKAARACVREPCEVQVFFPHRRRQSSTATPRAASTALLGGSGRNAYLS